MALDGVNRREFLGLTTASIAGGVLGLNASSSAAIDRGGWDPKKPLLCTGRTLVIKPVLMYRVAERRPATSWKSWGGVQTDEAAAAEMQKITKGLAKAYQRGPRFTLDDGLWRPSQAPRLCRSKAWHSMGRTAAGWTVDCCLTRF